MTRPGDRFRSFAQRLCRPETMARLIDPAVADLQHEHAEAAGRVGRVRALLAGYWSLFKVATHGIADCDAARGPVIAVALIVACTVPLVALPLWRFEHAIDMRATGSIVELVVCVIPQALGLSVPAGVVLGAIVAWRDPVARFRGRRVILGIAFAASVAGLANGQWLTPKANEQFREVIAGRPLLRGPAELSLTEAARRLRAGTGSDDGEEPARLALHLHSWLAFAATPLTLACFVVAAASIESRSLRRLLTAATLLAFVGFYTPLSHELHAWLFHTAPPIAVAWLPNAFVAAVAAALTAFRNRTNQPAIAQP